MKRQHYCKDTTYSTIRISQRNLEVQSSARTYLKLVILGCNGPAPVSFRSVFTWGENEDIDFLI